MLKAKCSSISEAENEISSILRQSERGEMVSSVELKTRIDLDKLEDLQKLKSIMLKLLDKSKRAMLHHHFSSFEKYWEDLIPKFKNKDVKIIIDEDVDHIDLFNKLKVLREHDIVKYGFETDHMEIFELSNNLIFIKNETFHTPEKMKDVSITMWIGHKNDPEIKRIYEKFIKKFYGRFKRGELISVSREVEELISIIKSINIRHVSSQELKVMMSILAELTVEDKKNFKEFLEYLQSLKVLVEVDVNIDDRTIVIYVYSTSEDTLSEIKNKANNMISGSLEDKVTVIPIKIYPEDVFDLIVQMLENIETPEQFKMFIDKVRIGEIILKGLRFSDREINEIKENLEKLVDKVVKEVLEKKGVRVDEDVKKALIYDALLSVLIHSLKSKDHDAQR